NALERLKSSPSPRIVLELTLVEMTMMERAVEIAALLEELRSLKGAAHSLPSVTRPSSVVNSGVGYRGSGIGNANVVSETRNPKPEIQEPKPQILSVTPLNDVAPRWGEFL